MNKTIFRLERDRIFEAALHLVENGKYNSTTIAEVSYHAGMTEMTTRLLFRSMDNLTRELIDHVSDRLDLVIAEAVRLTPSTRGQVAEVCRGLHDFYVRRPEMLAFMEQHNSPSKLGPGRPADDRLLSPLVRFFSQREEATLSGNAEITSRFIHGHVLICARMTIDAVLPSDREDSAKLLMMVLNPLLAAKDPVKEAEFIREGS